MQCTSPNSYNSNGVFISHVPPCGKCLACLATSRHQWASRLLLERKSCESAVFFTLTFSPEHLPESVAELKPLFQQFIMRIRNHEGVQPRYFTCMEFGSQYGRPHYHGIFFDREIKYEKRHTPEGKKYYTDPTIQDRWENGSTYSKDCPSSGQGMNITRYVANYILKNKWNSGDSTMPKEWALQSRKPYIGQPAVKHLCEALVTRNGARHCAILGTIPDKFKMCKKTWKIPLRIRREIGEILGYPVTQVPYSDGTIINIDQMEVRNEKTRRPISLNEAETLTRRLSTKIKYLRKTNTTVQTG